MKRGSASSSTKMVCNSASESSKEDGDGEKETGDGEERENKIQDGGGSLSTCWGNGT